MSTTGIGRLFVVAAPSGAGKTSLVHALLERVPALKFSVSYTTRPQRPKEVNGRDYFFVSPAKFEQMAADGKFLEHAEVFGNRYGTSAAHVAAVLDAGVSVLLEIDWQGARQIRLKSPQAIGIFILPPSIAELERRLRGRGTDSGKVIARRLHEAVSDMTHWDEFDYVVVNADFERALDALESIVSGRGGPHSTADPAVRARIKAMLGS